MPNDHTHASLEHERLDSLVNSMTDGVIALDVDLKVIRYNGAALNILNSNTSIQNKFIDKVLRPVDSHKQAITMSNLIRNATVSTESRDYSILYDDDSRCAIYLSIAPVHTGGGVEGIRGYVLLLRDITHEKSLEEEQSEFISVVSHELRTPVTIAEGSISNALLSVERAAKPEVVKKALTAAHDQILFLAHMINDLSTLSRAERGKLTLDVSTINIDSLLRDIVRHYKPAADEKGLAIDLQLNPKLESITSSELYIKEILQNFITNAIKYTDKGSVFIEASPTSKGVKVSVRDTGIGIKKSEQDKIFDKFFRSEDYRTRRNNGTGLGLYVTMKLVRILQADIQVESELNQGSTFTISFPSIGK